MLDLEGYRRSLSDSVRFLQKDLEDLTDPQWADLPELRQFAREKLQHANEDLVIINSLTPQERRYPPLLLDRGRARRAAAGAGLPEDAVFRMLAPGGAFPVPAVSGRYEGMIVLPSGGSFIDAIAAVEPPPAAEDVGSPVDLRDLNHVVISRSTNLAALALAWLWAPEKGDSEKALRYARRAVTHSSSARNLSVLATVEFHGGHHVEALETLERAIELGESDERTLLQREEYREALKRESSGLAKIIPEGAEWRYFVGEFEPPPEWVEPQFDDDGWPRGPSGFGFGDIDGRTVDAQAYRLGHRRRALDFAYGVFMARARMPGA